MDQVPWLPPLPDLGKDSCVLSNMDVDPHVSDDGNLYVPVAVGTVSGYYAVHVHKVVGSDGRLYTPTGFECAGGKENNRKWRLSLRVLLPDGTRGRTLGQWLITHELDHLVPPSNQRTLQKAGSTTPPGGSDLYLGPENPRSKSNSPEKRLLTDPLWESPTKSQRTIPGSSEPGCPGVVLPTLPPSPNPADVIGSFLQQHLAINSPAISPNVVGLTPAPTPAAPGPVPYQSTMSPPGAHTAPFMIFPGVSALRNASGGVTISTGMPILSSRVVGGPPPPPGTKPRQESSTGLGEKAPDTKAETGPMTKRAEHQVAGHFAVGLQHGHPPALRAPQMHLESSPPVVLPPPTGEHSGSSLDLARVFDYGDCPVIGPLSGSGFSPTQTQARTMTSIDGHLEHIRPMSPWDVFSGGGDIHGKAFVSPPGSGGTSSVRQVEHPGAISPGGISGQEGVPHTKKPIIEQRHSVQGWSNGSEQKGIRVLSPVQALLERTDTSIGSSSLMEPSLAPEASVREFE